MSCGRSRLCAARSVRRCCRGNGGRFVSSLRSVLDDPRRYQHPDVTVTVERQSGKTTVIRGVLLARAMIYRHRSAFYTAQTGKDATERWADLVQRIEHSALKSGVKVRKAIGTQRLIVANTESRLSPFAPTSESLHGYTPHDVAVDELFSFDDVRERFAGRDQAGAANPARPASHMAVYRRPRRLDIPTV